MPPTVTISDTDVNATIAGGAGPAAWKPVVAWATGLVCVVGPPATVVTYAGETYVCTTAHTAGGSFAAGNWTKVAEKGATGATGETGSTGAAGAAGPGLPTGGTTGQVARKQSGTNYDTAWGDDYYPGGADVAVADGGTGASTASAARTNLAAAPLGDFHLYLMTAAR